ncbi:MAG: hypothetical protein GZ091_16085 [Paludibacter sp.]|nr:hypothetical protein [Paludibacter sp.]
MNHSISNYYQYSNTLAAGAQPSESDIQALKDKGFDAIVNLSPASARNALQNEASLTEKANMHYVHFPVDCSNLRPLHYKTFEGIMRAIHDKKVFVHCGGNIKSSNLIHMYDVLVKEKDEEESLQTLKKIQNPEDKWFEYFRSFGMKGLR